MVIELLLVGEVGAPQTWQRWKGSEEKVSETLSQIPLIVSSSGLAAGVVN